MASISIIGAGKVGTTLGRVFADAGRHIADITSRTRASAEQARAVIGAGRIVELQDLQPAEIFMIAVSDNALHGLTGALDSTEAVRDGTVVFHCSGAIPSSALSPLREKGASVASVHPVKTFTDPLRDAQTFAGTWCAVEGDAAAAARLTELFEGVGARVFPVQGECKLIYHAANVFLCNYLFPLIEAGLQCYEQAGVPREVAAQVVDPILHATVANALRDGPAQAMTGPIARGDDRVVADQLRAVQAEDERLGELYRLLGRFSVDLAERKGAASAEGLARIRRLFSE
jgi:predicted short-subunit dehydrogenase-like oxidoreductase (DUF2520 family)